MIKVYIKTLFILVILFIISVPVLYSQRDAVISGRVFDKNNLEPLAYATVTLNNRVDSSLISGILTDAQGRFSISGIAEGEYFVSCS